MHGYLHEQTFVLEKYYFKLIYSFAAESYLHQCIELLKKREGHADFASVNEDATRSKARSDIGQHFNY